MSQQNMVAVVVPAYNEEKVISQCLIRLTNIFSSEDIYLVSDGSTDKTAEIALNYINNVLNLPVNQGKIGAIKQLLDNYHLMEKYDYIIFHDADSRILTDKEYFEKNLPLPDNVACLCSQVCSTKARRFFDAYRAYEYFVGNYVYKNAQSILRCIFVAPGCLTIYKSEVLKQLSFDSDTLTEDMDLTIQIHRRKLGRIIYDGKLAVDSHNPQNLKNFYRQIRRWHIGFWQNAKKHSLFKRFSPIDIELSFFLFEAILMGIILLLIPSILLVYPKLIGILLGTSWLLIIVVSVIAAVYLRRWRIILWSPLYIIIYFLNLFTFLGAFLGVYILPQVAVREIWYFQER